MHHFFMESHGRSCKIPGMMERSQTWIKALLGLIAVLIVIWLAPAPIYRARGILLPTQDTRSPIAADRVIQRSEPTLSGKVLGHVRIERYYEGFNASVNEEIK